jgi:hypothetical protein
MAQATLQTLLVVGDNTLIAGVGGQVITVQNYNIYSSEPVILLLKASDGTKLPVPFEPGVQIGYKGWTPFSLPVGTGLVANVDSPTELVGQITYTQA